MTIEFARAMGHFIDSGNFVNIYSFVNELGQEAMDKLIETDMENFRNSRHFQGLLLEEMELNLQDEYLHGVKTLEELGDKLEEFTSRFDESTYEELVHNNGLVEPAYEYYLINDRFADWLRCEGENVIDMGNQSVWCRKACGQWVGMDGCLRKALKNHYTHVFPKNSEYRVYLDNYYKEKEEKDAQKEHSIDWSVNSGSVGPYIEYLFKETMVPCGNDTSGEELFVELFKWRAVAEINSMFNLGEEFNDLIGYLETYYEDVFNFFQETFVEEVEALEEDCRYLTESERRIYLNTILETGDTEVAYKDWSGDISEEVQRYKNSVKKLTAIVKDNVVKHLRVEKDEEVIKEFKSKYFKPYYLTIPFGEYTLLVELY